MSHSHFDIRSIFAGRARLTLLGLALAAAVLIAYAHPGDLLGALPYLLLFACPLTNAFMVGGHAGHSYGREKAGAQSRLPTSDA